jgi:hypothetical protein
MRSVAYSLLLYSVSHYVITHSSFVSDAEMSTSHDKSPDQRDEKHKK